MDNIQYKYEHQLKRSSIEVNGTECFEKSKQKLEWKGINRKQSTRWQHLSQLKASAFFSLQIVFFSCYETQQLILGTGAAIWWVTEPNWNIKITFYLETSGAQSANLYLNVVRFFNTGANLTIVAAQDSCFPA